MPGGAATHARGGFGERSTRSIVRISCEWSASQKVKGESPGTLRSSPVALLPLKTEAVAGGAKAADKMVIAVENLIAKMELVDDGSMTMRNGRIRRR